MNFLNVTPHRLSQVGVAKFYFVKVLCCQPRNLAVVFTDACEIRSCFEEGRNLAKHSAILNCLLVDLFYLVYSVEGAVDVHEASLQEKKTLVLKTLTHHD